MRAGRGVPRRLAHAGRRCMSALRRARHTSSSRWLKPRCSNVTMPCSGRDFDARAATTSVSAWMCRRRTPARGTRPPRSRGWRRWCRAWSRAPRCPTSRATVNIAVHERLAELGARPRTRRRGGACAGFIVIVVKMTLSVSVIGAGERRAARWCRRAGPRTTDRDEAAPRRALSPGSRSAPGMESSRREPRRDRVDAAARRAASAAAIGTLPDWLEEHRGLRFDGYHDLWQWSVDDLDGFWGSFTEWIGVRWRDAPSRRARRTGRCPARCGSRAARSTTPSRRWRRRTSTARRRRDRRREPDPCAARAHVGASSPTRWRAVAPGCAGSVSGRAIGSRRTLPNIPETLVAFLATASLGRDLVVVRAGVRHALGRRPLRADRADGAARGRRLPLRREGRRPARRRARRSRPRCPTLRAHGARRRTSVSGRRRLDGAARRATSPLAFEPVAVRPSAVRALQLGHDRPAEGDRARPRRHRRRAPQDARVAPRPRRRATASSGSPPPAG